VKLKYVSNYWLQRKKNANNKLLASIIATRLKQAGGQPAFLHEGQQNEDPMKYWFSMYINRCADLMAFT
jgi:hypothetical protein